MYVDPFAMGVFTTLAAEMLILIIYGFFHRRKK